MTSSRFTPAEEKRSAAPTAVGHTMEPCSLVAAAARSTRGHGEIRRAWSIPSAINAVALILSDESRAEEADDGLVCSQTPYRRRCIHDGGAPVTGDRAEL